MLVWRKARSKRIRFRGSDLADAGIGHDLATLVSAPRLPATLCDLPSVDASGQPVVDDKHVRNPAPAPCRCLSRRWPPGRRRSPRRPPHTHNEFQFGGFNSPASQPTASVCIGSTAKRTTRCARRSSTRRCVPRISAGRERCAPTPCGACKPDTSDARWSRQPSLKSPSPDHTPSVAGVFDYYCRFRQRERARSDRIDSAGPRASTACVAPPPSPKSPKGWAALIGAEYSAS
ncbi:hypothetical protein ABIF33_009157 [Bradyrhizobium elkanii]